MRTILRVAVAATVVALGAASTFGTGTGSAAGPLGTTIPAHCVDHTTFEPGGADAAGDLRCAGLAIDFHHGGPQRSPQPLWAGQWLFVDEAGQYRVGSCTFQRGVHPSTLGPSTPVAQHFPLDVDGRRRAYLTWRHGDTTDHLTAAALWAVFHFYAQDSAGSSRSTNPDASLVPDLTQLTEMTGNQQLEDLAVALDAEAAHLSGAPALTLTFAAGDIVAASVVAGSVPFSGVPVTITSGPHTFALVTGPDGTATAEVPLGDAGGVVSATASVPGDAVVYAGPPAAPDPNGVQTLLTAGTPAEVRAVTERPSTTTTTTATLPPTTTTTTTLPPTTTTTTLPPTTSPPTTLPPETTSTLASTTVAETTISAPDASVAFAPPETTTTTPRTTETVEVLAPPPPPGPPVTLPRTGSESNGPAYAGTALLVAGIGLLGAISRRRALEPW